MKSKKNILTIFSVVLILVLTTVSFATKTGMTFDEAVEASKERDKNISASIKEEKEEKTEETVKEETTGNIVDGKEQLQDKLEENKKEETKNELEELEKEDNQDKSEEIKKEDSKDKLDGNKEELKNNVDDTKKEESDEDIAITFIETISKDIVKVGNDIEYESIYVDGNVHIMGNKVSLKNYKVDGNLFICAETVEIDNVLIDGTCYIAAQTVEIDGYMKSAYIAAKNVTITAFANIEKDLRIVASDLIVEGSIGRDLYVYVENLKMSDRANIFGDCMVEATAVDISEDAKINGEKVITIVDNFNKNVIDSKYIYNTIITNSIIVLIIAIFVLYSSPKFVEVNNKLRLRDFIKAFFTGILELALAIAIFIGLTYVGYGIGFSLALLILALIFVYFGKTIFIISAGIRLARKKENISRIKVFFLIVIVLIIVEAVDLLKLLGNSGLLVAMIINLILGIAGFGSFVRVLLTPTKKVKIISQAQTNIREAKPGDFVMKGAPIKDEKAEKPSNEIEDVKEEITEDIKVEEKISNEMEEVKKEKIEEEKVEETKEDK